MELACSGCGRKIRLVPHGEGRYAPPGQPPPPPPSEDERVPPWMQGGRGRTAHRRRKRPATAPREPVDAPRVEIPEPDPAPPEPEPTDDAEMTVRRALEILEITPAATQAEIDRAFRERSRTCHPDKVAHLDADFQALAERKFKTLKAAYDLLRA